MKRDFVVSIYLNIWDLENMLLLIPLYFTLSKMALSGKKFAVLLETREFLGQLGETNSQQLKT